MTSFTVSAEGVALALRSLRAAEPDSWAPLLAAACARHEINTPDRVASFLANLSHESDHFSRLVEDLNYSIEGLLKTFSRARISEADCRRLGRKPSEKGVISVERQRQIANLVYGGAWGLHNLGNTQPEDGYYFRGKGLIQLTGRANHTRFARMIGTDVVTLQGLLVTREGAVESAAHFWSRVGCNGEADLRDHTTCRKLVNGGALGLGEVILATSKAAAVLKAVV